MIEYLEKAFSGPPMIASCLMVLVSLYWLTVILGMVDIDGLGFDLDLDGDVDVDMSSVASIGLLPLRWLNLGRVPVMLWMSVFTLGFWLTSMLWDTPAGRDNMWNMAAVLLRNGAIGLLATKVVTQPLCGVFSERSGAATTAGLIGMECVPTTRVTEDRGQAKVDFIKGSDLLLSVRTDFGELEKGERAQIVDYDEGREVYIVRRTPNEV